MCFCVFRSVFDIPGVFLRIQMRAFRQELDAEQEEKKKAFVQQRREEMDKLREEWSHKRKNEIEALDDEVFFIPFIFSNQFLFVYDYKIV